MLPSWQGVSEHGISPASQLFVGYRGSCQNTGFSRGFHEGEKKRVPQIQKSHEKNPLTFHEILDG